MDKLVELGLVERLKNRNLIWEDKMTKLNQNKYSKQPYRSDAVWKLCFTLEINEWDILVAQLLTSVLQNRFCKSIRNVQLVQFLQSWVM